jgi:hypothetical protein
MKKVQALKLTNGQEVISEVKQNIRLGGSDEVISYTLTRPFVLHLSIMPGGMDLAMVPFTLANPGLREITIPAKMVDVVFEPSIDVERRYLEQTSGIAVAPAGSRISS